MTAARTIPAGRLRAKHLGMFVRFLDDTGYGYCGILDSVEHSASPRRTVVRIDSAFPSRGGTIKLAQTVEIELPA